MYYYCTATRRYEHEDVVDFLIKYGASLKNSAPGFGTAADQLRRSGASAEQTQYIAARTLCANPHCDGTGVKKCAGCLKVRYCTQKCQPAHGLALKAECRRSAKVAAGTDNLN